MVDGLREMVYRGGEAFKYLDGRYSIKNRLIVWVWRMTNLVIM